MRFALKALIVIAATGALAIAGCGSGTDTSTTSAVKSTTAQKGTAPPQAKAEKKGEKSQGTGAKQPSAPAPTSGAPLPNESTKAVAPGVPASRGGDNSVQAFGLESESDERIRAAATVSAYLRALATGDWAEACSRLAAQTRVQLSRLGGKLQGGPATGCESTLRSFTARLPASVLRSAARIHVLSLRVQGDRAFLIYRDAEGTVSQLPMSRDGGGWKVAAVSGAPIGL